MLDFPARPAFRFLGFFTLSSSSLSRFTFKISVSRSLRLLRKRQQRHGELLQDVQPNSFSSHHPIELLAIDVASFCSSTTGGNKLRTMHVRSWIRAWRLRFRYVLFLSTTRLRFSSKRNHCSRSALDTPVDALTTAFQLLGPWYVGWR